MQCVHTYAWKDTITLMITQHFPTEQLSQCLTDTAAISVRCCLASYTSRIWNTLTQIRKKNENIVKDLYKQAVLWIIFFSVIQPCLDLLPPKVSSSDFQTEPHTHTKSVLTDKAGSDRTSFTAISTHLL